MDVMERIRQRYPTMTAALQKFADFVLAEPVMAARMSIHSAVKEVDLSVASANRFARAIGYENYPAFRSDLIQSLAPAFVPVKRLEVEVSRASSTQEVIESSLIEDIANLQRTVTALNKDSCIKAVDMILEAERVLVVGFDNGACLAQILANGLVPLKENVATTAFIGSGLSGARHLARMGPADMVIAIAFPRYIKDTVRLAEVARSRHIPVLAITDCHRSALAKHADLSLFVSVQRQFSSVSNAAALAMIEAVLAAVSQKTPLTVKRAETFTELALPWIEAGDR